MNYSLENLESQVKLVADDDFIKKIIREYLQIDPENFKKTNDLYDLIYSKLRVDPNSIGKINQSDKRLFLQELYADYAKHSNLSDNPLTEQPGFLTFKSWHLLKSSKISSNDMRHRLYINCKADNLMALSNAIYSELKGNNIPFYFKIPNNDYNEKGFKDSIVIYTSTEYLKATIESLLNIEKNNPELIHNCNEPSELVGKITSWLGYASETEVVKHSYTSNVCIGVANAIEKSVKEWCLNHGDVRIGDTTIRNYYHDYMLWDEYRIKTQALVSNIPKIDHNFVKNVCNKAREEFIALGLNPDNLCMTDIAKKEIEKSISESREESKVKEDNEVNAFILAMQNTEGIETLYAKEMDSPKVNAFTMATGQTDVKEVSNNAFTIATQREMLLSQKEALLKMLEEQEKLTTMQIPPNGNPKR